MMIQKATESPEHARAGMERQAKAQEAYEKPKVRDFGDLRALTRATQESEWIDVPIGTNLADLDTSTFSSTNKG